MDSIGTTGSQYAEDRDAPLVVHVIHKLQTGGMENGLVNLVNNLPEGRYRHAIVCMTDSTEFEERIRTGKVSIHALRKRPGKELGVYVRFWHLLRNLKPTIVHTRNLGTLDLAPVAALAGVPVRIHGEHGWNFDDPTGVSRKYRFLRKLCDKVMSQYVAVSQDIAEWLKESIGVEDCRIQQIYNGVDTDLYRPDGPWAILPFTGQRDDLLIIGTVGRLDPIKNIGFLVKAYAKMLDENPEFRKFVRLVIVGDGPDLDDIRTLVDRHGLKDLVWLAGDRDDIADLMRSIDVFVLPSINEGISNTILEAMATGLPVVASNVGGNCELIVQNETGTLVDVNEYDSFISAAKQYALGADLRRQHGGAARERAVAYFGLTAMVDQYAQMYDRHLFSQSGKRLIS